MSILKKEKQEMAIAALVEGGLHPVNRAHDRHSPGYHHAPHGSGGARLR